MANSSITMLEEQLAHQSIEIERLSDELYAQQKEITQLKKQIGHFKQTVESLSHIRAESDEAPPPHY